MASPVFDDLIKTFGHKFYQLFTHFDHFYHFTQYIKIIASMSLVVMVQSCSWRDFLIIAHEPSIQSRFDELPGHSKNMMLLSEKNFLSFFQQ